MDSPREYLQIETQDSLFFLNLSEQETHFSCESTRALPEVAQKGCGASILGNSGELTECDPELLAIGGPV